jgi:hypothetical protein
MPFPGRKRKNWQKEWVMETVNAGSKVKLTIENSNGGSDFVCSANLKEFISFMGHLDFFIAEGKGGTRGLDAVTALVENFKTQAYLADKAEDLLAEASGGQHNLEIKRKQHISSLKEAKKMLITISSRECPSVKEINIIMHELVKRIDDKAIVYYNGARDIKLGDKLQISVIASE